MADTGRIVTDEEVIANLRSIGSIGTTERRAILAAERAVERYCCRRFDQQTYDRERHTLPSLITYGGVIQKQPLKVRVNNPPIITWIKLENETTTNEDGTPDEDGVYLVDRKAYFVDSATGWIHLTDFYGRDWNAYLSGESAAYLTDKPGGVMLSYVGGYAADDMPDDLVEAVLMIVGRLYKLMKEDKLELGNIQTDFGVQLPLRVRLTMEERSLLRPFRLAHLSGAVGEW